MKKRKESLFADKSRLFPFGDNLMTRQVLIEKVGQRIIKKGEFYLSGAIPTVYRAPNDFSEPVMVVKAFKPGPETIIIRERGEEVR